MRTLFIVLLAALVSVAARAGEIGRVHKVISLLADSQGRVATSPSLFDRDAYQAYLREHPAEVAAQRYEVLWHAENLSGNKYILRLELRGVTSDGRPKLKTLETPVTPGLLRKWKRFELGGDEFKQFGNVVAWRVSLLNGSSRLSEQKSFLW
jgi:hypothetical protein